MSKPPSSKTQWNPATYLEFAAYRARPAEDLMARLELRVPGAIYDLGCGPGNLTRKLKDRWPDRAVIGTDSSPEMLAKAEKSFGAADITWRLSDIATGTPETGTPETGTPETGTPEAPPALIFTNAALQWVPDHDRLFPRLMAAVAPGGLFAMQMPVTGEAPYHACIKQILVRSPWRERLAGVRSDQVHAASAQRYYDLVSPLAATVDTWEAYYHHVLKDTAAVTAWVSGTALVPYLTALREDEKAAFLADYTDLALAAYPASKDGKVLFTMRRLFILAERKA